MRRVALLLLISLGGCGTDPEPAAARQGALAGEDPVEICRSVFTREYECRAEFIPALVDLRIKLDLPSGIAARARREGRAALIEVAHGEYAVDGTEPRRSETCKRVAVAAPPGSLRSAQACLQRSGCPAFVSCVMPMHEARLRGRK